MSSVVTGEYFSQIDLPARACGHDLSPACRLSDLSQPIFHGLYFCVFLFCRTIEKGRGMVNTGPNGKSQQLCLLHNVFYTVFGDPGGEFQVSGKMMKALNLLKTVL